jgi:hypothetical protein
VWSVLVNSVSQSGFRRCVVNFNDKRIVGCCAQDLTRDDLRSFRPRLRRSLALGSWALLTNVEH